MSPNSRIWIYQSETSLAQEVQAEIQAAITQFCQIWHAHGKPVKAMGSIEHNRFIILVVDEESFVSGCSIDSSVAFIKNIERKYGLSLFNRMLVNYFDDGQLHTVPLSSIGSLLKDKKITPETLILDHTITTLEQLNHEWAKPLKNSWLNRLIPAVVGTNPAN